MHTALLPQLCRRLCAVAVWPLLILSAVRADGEPFVARFETDATGTWLTYPTVPGWHYKVESSPTLEEDDFTFVQSTFSYGNGTVRRLFIAPPRPPADPNYQPPVRTFRLINVRLHVATDPGMEKVELLGPGDPPAWGMEMNRSLPVFRWTRHVFLTGDTPTERWMFSATITARPYASEDPATPGFQFPGPAVIPQSAQADIDFVTDHWQDIIGHLTPSPEDTTLLPAPPPPVTSPESTPAPPLTSPARRYYRVRQTAIDTNGNGLYDWWELAHAYSAFAEPGTPGYLDGTADPDHDGLTNTQEQNNGTNHLLRDSDGDHTPDGDEILHGTDPLSPRSAPVSFLTQTRYVSMPISWINGGYLYNKNFYQQNPAGADPYPFIPVPGHEGGGPEIPGVPAYEGLSGELEVFVPFLLQPPPWLLQQSPSLAGDPEANATAEMDGEGGGTLTHHRVWARGAAPEDADLLIPVEKLTWEHPDTAPESYTSTVIYLRIPAGENISEDFIDITPTYPQFTIPNQATYWEAIHHGSKERAQFFYVQTSTGTKPETIEVAVMVRKLTSDGKFKMPAQSQKAQSLSVAKLVPAQDESNPEQAYIPLQALGGGVGAGEQINPTKDPDHFRVVVRDPTKRGQSPRIRITTECDEPGFESYSDQAASGDQNTLQMSHQPGDGNQELIQSPTLILVSDDTDDAHPIDGVADNAPNDRSRKVALGSKVKVELIDWAKNGVFPVITVPVPKLKTLTINAVVMTDSPIMAQGQEAATQKVLMDLRKTNERYAQVGLRINLSNNGQPEFKQPPASGSIADPPIADLDNPNIRIFPPYSNNVAIGALARSTGQPVEENPEITFIYCKAINKHMGDKVWGFAVMPSRMPTYQPLWNMLFLAPEDQDYVIAHELGHILTKRGHWYENYPFPEWPQGVNWPYSLETRINLMVHLGNWKDVINEGPVGSLPAKRLNRIQHSAIWLHDQVK